MTSDQVKAIDESFDKIAPITEQAASLFCVRLFEVALATKPLFRGEMKEQSRKLMATLAIVVNGLDNRSAILPAASAVAKFPVAYAKKTPVIAEVYGRSLAAQ